MITSPKWLIAPYLFNILILIPVCYQMFFGNSANTNFEGKVPESDGMRLMIASLWLAILLGSIAGLVWPAFFAPIILVQIIYKTTWLIAFVLPLWRADEPFPVGISICFLLIVLSYPVFFWLSTR